MNSENKLAKDVKVSLPENETVTPVAVEKVHTVLVSYTLQGQVEIQVPENDLTSDKAKNEEMFQHVLTNLSDKELVHSLEGYASGEIDGDAIVVIDSTIVSK